MPKSLSESQYQERIADIERHVRRTSFACQRGECSMDFYEHGQFMIDYLTTLVEADFYGVSDPEMPVSQCPSLEVRCKGEVVLFRQNWEAIV
jgi:hypothetical protein